MKEGIVGREQMEGEAKRPSDRPARRDRGSVRVRSLGTEADWYRDAIFYEVRVRSFFDDDGDGIGDFRGLTKKLDYLKDLGVTVLWLLPFYPSPLRDDGYDISSYTDVHPEVGTLADFREFLHEAHLRGLYVVTELVLNHTSDQHPWFQRARRAPKGSAEREYYVWSETPDRYKDARIIFKDFETSNWAWDPVAGEYYWHRFYSHQPDLNFENPHVQRSLMSVVDFWLDLGVDGMRLDAVPYLYEAEATNCENLPETHGFLKKLRRHVDQNFPNRMLLAEANQWPEDAVAYFGEGDECHMAFHFPIMPRIFMSIHMEDRFPLVDILAQTPPIPSGCQWALFLRNHDELTLEMVTDEERDYMVRAYAHDPTMRINLGIRRRLAPLCGGDRRNMELMNALLFSLPGTPVLYYGDEIGMGDNVYLGDRNGVRTPMQWSADKNAGFSRVNPQRLILPIIIDPEYHYEAVNVEAQQGNASSLLWWTKRLIAMRKRYRAFGRGSFEFLTPDNPKVLAFVRAHEEETILVVANLSRHVQFVRLDLSRFEGATPVELFGRTRLPTVGADPYFLTLGGHDFFWLSLERPRADTAGARAAAYRAPEITLPGMSVADAAWWDPATSTEDRAELEPHLAAWLESRPWFDGDGHPVASVKIVEAVPIGEAKSGEIYLLIVEAGLGAGRSQRWVVPVGFASGERAHRVQSALPDAVLVTLRLSDDPREQLGVVFDALADVDACRMLAGAILDRRSVRGLSGQIAGTVAEGVSPPESESAVMKKLASGKPVVELGSELVMKFLRRLDAGESPDLELGRYLTEKEFAATAPVIGALELTSGRGERSTLAILRRYVQNEGDAWAHARAELGRYFERVLAQSDEEEQPEPTAARPFTLARAEPPRVALNLVGGYLEAAKLLGRRTAELHVCLAESTDPAFAPESYTSLDRRSEYQSLRNLAGRLMRSLRSALLSAEAVPDATFLMDNERLLYERFEPLLSKKLAAMRTRCHGNYHLGQVLHTGRDFIILDFEGERSRPISERRRKRSPLIDLASMLRSFHYAAFRGVFDAAVVREADRGRAMRWADLWHTWVGAAFVGGYLELAQGTVSLPADMDEASMLCDLFVLEKAMRELVAELAEPSTHVRIPLRAVVQALRGSG